MSHSPGGPLYHVAETLAPAARQRHQSRVQEPVLRPVRSIGTSGKGVRVETPRGAVRVRNVSADSESAVSPDSDAPQNSGSSALIAGNSSSRNAISGITRASPPSRHGGNALSDSRGTSVARRVEEAFAGMGTSDSDSDYDGLD